MYDLNLKNQTIVITGACGILGQNFCRGFAEQKANIVLIDRDQEQCDQQAKMLEQEFGVQALGIQCDITDKDQVAAALSQVKEKFKTVNVLLNNAASKSSSLEKFFEPFETFELDTWKEVMSVNVDGMFLMAQAFGSEMAKAGQGTIIQVSSIYGILAPDQRIYEGSEYMNMAINTPAVYSASKAAVVGLSNYLTTYWGEKGVRVNTLTPGGVASGQNTEFNNKYSARVPLGRMAKAEDMVNGALFLASDKSNYITGHNLVVDGGLSVW